MTDIRDALAEAIAKSVSVGNPELRAITRTVDAILAEFIVVPIGDAKPSIQPWLDAERLTYEAMGRDVPTKPTADLEKELFADVERWHEAALQAAIGQQTAEEERDTAYAEVERMMTDRGDLRATLDRVRDMARWVDTVPADDIEAALDAATEPAADLHVGDDAPSQTRCDRTVGSRPSWMGVDQYDPCRCLLSAGHDGDCACEHTASSGDGQ